MIIINAHSSEFRTSKSNMKQNLDTLYVCMYVSSVWAWTTEIGEKMLFLLHFEESDPSAILVVFFSFFPVLLYVKLQSQILNKL